MNNTLILILFIIATIALFLPHRKARQIKRWRRDLAINKHQLIFQQLYANADGFALSRAARRHGDAIEYVYGEIDFESFVALLSLCNPRTDTVFYDLGSGIGKAVLACAMVFDVHKSYGVELFSGLHESAKEKQEHLSLLPQYQKKAACIFFKQGNFLDENLSAATITFINSSAYFGELWLQISQHVEHMQPGSLVISTSKALISNLFITVNITSVKMSWGVVKAFIQQRV